MVVSTLMVVLRMLDFSWARAMKSRLPANNAERPIKSGSASQTVLLLKKFSSSRVNFPG